MVIPMKKYTFLVYHNDLDSFLDSLSTQGVVHLEARGGQPEGGSLEEIGRQIARVDKSLRMLQPLAPKGEQAKAEGDADRIMASLDAFAVARDRAAQAVASLEKEIEQLEPWGDFDPASFTRLEAQGVFARFFTAPVKKFKQSWTESYSVTEVARDKKLVYLAGFFREDDETATPADEVTLPMASLATLQKQLAGVRAELSQAEASLEKLAAWGCAPLQARLEDLEDRLTFEQARLSGELTVEDKLVILEGWVPNTRLVALDGFLSEKGIVHMSADPAEGETPPVAVKNGFFSRLFEPIAGLFSLPSYYEFDLTAAFAPFFTLFFGLCLGDAGYGVVIFLVAFIGRFKVKQELKPMMSLLMILSFSTMAVGILTGTLFGVELFGVPFFKNFLLMSNPDAMKDFLFNFALIIGVVQILFGMLIRVIFLIKREGFLASLNQMGWFFMVIAICLLWARDKNPGFLASARIGSALKYVLIASLALIVLFKELKGNFFKRIFSGLYNLYDITGFLGDMLSYVRLFALGLSSGILGLVVNSIGANFQSIPVVGPVIFIVFLIVGHTANLLLAGLGSFVHPMRLTFVEFYKNAGFEGGGREYVPFAQKK